MDTIFRTSGCVKVTHQLSKQEIDHIESVIEKFSISFRRTTQFVLSSKKKGKRGASKAEPPKFHTLKAHLVPFLREYNAGWPYSEEGIESSHHWIKFFREKTSHVTGTSFKRKYGSFISSWQLNKSEDGIAELDNVLQEL